MRACVHKYHAWIPHCGQPCPMMMLLSPADWVPPVQWTFDRHYDGVVRWELFDGTFDETFGGSCNGNAGTPIQYSAEYPIELSMGHLMGHFVEHSGEHSTAWTKKSGRNRHSMRSNVRWGNDIIVAGQPSSRRLLGRAGEPRGSPCTERSCQRTQVSAAPEVQRGLSSLAPGRLRYIGHNHIGHNYVGHRYIGHNYICHNYIGISM